MRNAALLAMTLSVTGCGSCGHTPAEPDPPDATPASSAIPSRLDGASVLDGAITVTGPVDRAAAQRIAMAYADEHWGRFHPQTATSLWTERNGNYHVLIEFNGEFRGGKVVATVFVRPRDGSIDDAGIYVPDGGK